MPDFSVVGLFCEDIREEVGGTNTIVGILPDNINVPGPGAIPKLALYIRIHLATGFDPGQILVRVYLPSGEIIMAHEIDAAVTKKANDEAKAKGGPIAGIISRSGWANFPSAIPGKVRAVVTIGGEEILCAALNIQFINVATASALPLSQSPAAVPAIKS